MPIVDGPTYTRVVRCFCCYVFCCFLRLIPEREFLESKESKIFWGESVAVSSEEEKKRAGENGW